MRNNNGESGPVPQELEPDSGSESKPVGAIPVGDRTFSSVEELAEAYRNAEAHRKALETVVGRQGNELGKLRNAGGEPSAANEEDDLGIPKELFDSFEAKFVENPGAAIKDVVKTTVAATTKRVTSELSDRFRRENVVESFWNDYFEANPSHKTIETYVRMEGNSLVASGSLAGLNREQQMTTIARQVNEIGKKAFSGETVKDVKDRRVVSEPGRGSGAGVSSSRSPKPEKKVTFMDEVRSSVYRKADGI